MKTNFVLCLIIGVFIVPKSYAHSDITLNSCTLSCDSSTSQMIRNNVMSPIQETFRRLRNRGPRGETGPKGESGAPGRSCGCSQYAKLEADVEILKQTLQDLKIKAYGVPKSTASTTDSTTQASYMSTPTTATTKMTYFGTTESQRTKRLIQLGYKHFINNYWYKLHRNSVVYKVAKQTCAEEGGRLASTGLRDPTLRDAIMNQVALPNGSDTRIGLTDLTGQNYWVWSDGVESNSNNTIWNTGEPNNIGTEHCTQMYYRNWKVNNLACSHPLYFLCEASWS